MTHELLKSRGNKPRTGKVIVCICGKEFYVRPAAIRANNYCSKACFAEGLKSAILKNCTVCAKEYRVHKSQEKHRGESRYCSRKCLGINQSARQMGENNPSWKGGISTEHHRIRQSKKFKDWRVAVFTRDNYTCQHCGVHGGYLEPDHIKPFAYFPELRFELSNGRTLCKPCHKETDTYGVKAKRLYAKHKN